jgi:hypothetical protein
MYLGTVVNYLPTFVKYVTFDWHKASYFVHAIRVKMTK